MPQSSTLPLRSAFCAWITLTSGRTEGTAASTSPVNGQVTLRISGLTFGRSEPAQARSTAKGSPEAPAT